MNRVRDGLSEPRRGRVLVVDEDPVARLAIDQQLDALGWDAIAVSNGTEAIRVIELGLLVNVLLINLRLPDLDARAVADVIATMSPHIRVAFLADAIPRRPVEPRHAPLLVAPSSTSQLERALSGAIRLAGRRYPR
jgi:CheY-like chemotaxis protein